MSNEELYEVAKQAIENLFSDKSVDLQKALDNLGNLQDEIDIFIEAIKSDIRNQE